MGASLLVTTGREKQGGEGGGDTYGNRTKAVVICPVTMLHAMA